MSSYSLIDEPWIPVATAAGTQERIGLAALFERAHELRGISHPNPLCAIGAYRLVFAVFQAAIDPPRDASAWREVWADGACPFDAAAVLSYLDAWRHRFDLFHPERPFGQVPAWDAKGVGTVASISFEIAGGNNATLFDHGLDDHAPDRSPADAAMAVLAYQHSAAGGRIPNEPGSVKQAPYRGVAFVLPTGSSLAQTLVLNTIWRRDGAAFNGSKVAGDRPLWESRTLPEPLEARRPVGALELLTWTPRRITLHPVVDDAGELTVRHVTVGCLLEPGADVPKDPWAAYRRSKVTEPWLPYGLSTVRACWRDAHVLFAFSDDADTDVALRPTVLDQLAQCDVTPSLEVLGADTFQAKVISWRGERLPVSRALLTDRHAVFDVSDGLAFARTAAKVLAGSLADGWATLMHANASGAHELGTQDRQDARERVNAGAAPRFFWGSLSRPFASFIHALDASRAEAVETWTARVWDACDRAFELGLKEFGENDGADRARAIAERRYFWRKQQHNTEEVSGE